MGKVLTDEQIEQYNRDGYVYPVQAMSEEEISAAANKVEAFE